MSSIRLRELAAGRLDGLFQEDVYVLPIASLLPVNFDSAPASLLIVGGELVHDPDAEALAIAQLACAIAQRERVVREVEERMQESALQELDGSVMSADSRKGVCEAVMASLQSLIPFEAGVLYLLDPDPGRSEYLVYGASRNESDADLFASYYSRSDLGFTWKVAMERRPRAGSVADVPQMARHKNRSALAHISKRYEAWALVPLSAKGSTRAVVHIEGVRFLEGASLADLEVMRRVGGRLGSLIDGRLRTLARSSGEASLRDIEMLRSIAGMDSPSKRPSLESYAVTLFSALPGVVCLQHESRTIPQLDGFFLLKNLQQLFVVEVKAPDDNEHQLGSEAIRQLVGEMEAVGAGSGFLVTTARFSSRTTDIVPRNFAITVLDGRALERFSVLAPNDRLEILQRWLAREPGIGGAFFG